VEPLALSAQASPLCHFSHWGLGGFLKGGHHGPNLAEPITGSAFPSLQCGRSAASPRHPSARRNSAPRGSRANARSPPPCSLPARPSRSHHARAQYKESKPTPTLPAQSHSLAQYGFLPPVEDPPSLAPQPGSPFRSRPSLQGDRSAPPPLHPTPTTPKTHPHHFPAPRAAPARRKRIRLWRSGDLVGLGCGFPTEFSVRRSLTDSSAGRQHSRSSIRTSFPLPCPSQQSRFPLHGRALSAESIAATIASKGPCQLHAVTSFATRLRCYFPAPSDKPSRLVSVLALLGNHSRLQLAERSPPSLYGYAWPRTRP